MKEKAQAMVMASLAADSLALGVHWIYDAMKIKSEHGLVDRLLAPKQDSYHPTKKKGEFTHYGDQTLVLLESVAASGGFDLGDFYQRWQALFKEYDGYLDMATKGTLGKIARGKSPNCCGSDSNDIAGASRIAPLILSLRDKPDQLVEAVRAQTMMTHQDMTTLDCAEFFSLVALECLNGALPSQAVRNVAKEEFSDSPIGQWTRQGIEAREEESVPAVIRFGQSCHTTDAFAGIIQIIAKYEGDLARGVVQAVMAGGDNAARASITAMILAAHQGLDSKTREWFQGLVKKATIEQFLDKIG
ncbi:MAG: ADP-ribosylglycohydrolase family protein [Desulfobacteraceae bacterium]|nr:ADP-ribosylglycohydrolase family protein [Desulfobacteraceae bacterium]